MKPNFTPGPWKVFDPVEYGTLEVQNEECDPVASGIEDGSDAAIIAAAPEMYEALEAVEEYFEVKRKPDLYQDPGTLISLLAESAKRLVIEALKKARGEK